MKHTGLALIFIQKNSILVNPNKTGLFEGRFS